MAQYKVTLQVMKEGSIDPSEVLGSEVWGRVFTVDPDDRKAFVTEFGWLGHDLLTELKRTWQVELATVSE